jgi:hypothetical protein
MYWTSLFSCAFGVSAKVSPTAARRGIGNSFLVLAGITP